MHFDPITGTYTQADLIGSVRPPAPVETQVAPAVSTATRVSVNPAETLPISTNNFQNLEAGMGFVDMQCIKIAPSALLPKGANL